MTELMYRDGFSWKETKNIYLNYYPNGPFRSIVQSVIVRTVYYSYTGVDLAVCIQSGKNATRIGPSEEKWFYHEYLICK